MRTIFTTFLLVTCGIIFGQKPNTDFRIFSNVLQNIDISHPRANIGIEKDFKNNQSLSFGIGMYYRNWMYNEPTNGMNLSFEYKKFKNDRIYFALGLSGGKLKYSTSSEFYLGDMKTADSTYFEKHKIDKILGDLYLNVGFRKNIGSKFYLDIFAGIGLRYKEVNHIGRSRPEDEYKEGFYLVNIRDNPKQSFVPIIKFGLVIGLTL